MPRSIWGPEAPTDNLFFDVGAVLGIQEGPQGAPNSTRDAFQLPSGPLRDHLEVILGARGRFRVDLYLFWGRFGPLWVDVYVFWEHKLLFWRCGVSILNQLVVEALVSKVGFIWGWKLDEFGVFTLIGPDAGSLA